MTYHTFQPLFLLSLYLLKHIPELGIVDHYTVVEVEGDGLLGHYLQTFVILLALFEGLGELLEQLCLSGGELGAASVEVGDSWL